MSIPSRLAIDERTKCLSKICPSISDDLIIFSVKTCNRALFLTSKPRESILPSKYPCDFLISNNKF